MGSASRSSSGGILAAIKNLPARQPAPPAPDASDPAVAAVINQTQADQRQNYGTGGRASTILTGGLGLLDNPFTSRKTLLGF